MHYEKDLDRNSEKRTDLTTETRRNNYKKTHSEKLPWKSGFSSIEFGGARRNSPSKLKSQLQKSPIRRTSVNSPAPSNITIDENRMKYLRLKIMSYMGGGEKHIYESAMGQKMNSLNK